MKTCSRCKEDKELSEFAKRSSMCKICHREYTREHYQANKQYYLDKARRNSDLKRRNNRIKILEYLKTHPCVDCGINDPEVVDFDHRDATLKTANVAHLIDCSWKKIEEEIGKCDVRCKNCHVKRTRRQFGHWTVEDFPGVYPLATNQLKG